LRLIQGKGEAAMNSLANALEGKRVLIVGGVGEGIGRAVTRAVGAAGAACVVVTGRNLERANEAAKEIESPTCRAIAMTGDVTSLEDIERHVAATVKRFGGIDVLITSVGGINAFTEWQPLHETSDESWDLILDVNVRYVFRYCRAVLKVFLAQGKGGAIVSIGSTAGIFGVPHAASYGVAKAGLMSLCKSLSAEYGRRGVRMNVINCGPIATAAAAGALDHGAAFENVPLGRPGSPEEVADAVVYLASDLSRFMIGQSVNFDGGTTSRNPIRLPLSDASMSG
jgi:3-oxoacyl-[acyl-carrier protein] reductase